MAQKNDVIERNPWYDSVFERLSFVKPNEIVSKTIQDSANILFVSLVLDDSNSATAKKETATATAPKQNDSIQQQRNSNSIATATQQKGKKSDKGQGT